MKTNKKRVINILLSLALTISLLAALGGMAMAIDLTKVTDACAAGDNITVEFGSSAPTFASLVARNTDDLTKIEYLNQYDLTATNSFTFPVDSVALKGQALEITVAADVGAGTIKFGVEFGVEKAALVKAIEAAEKALAKEVFVPGEGDAATSEFAQAIAAAKVVNAGPSSQAKVNAAVDTLAVVQSESTFTADKVLIELPAMISMKKGEDIQLTAHGEGASEYIKANFSWKSSNALIATVDSTGFVQVKSKVGTVIITATDNLTGLLHQIVIRVT